MVLLTKTKKSFIWCGSPLLLLGLGVAVLQWFQWNEPLFYVLNRLPWPILWSNVTELGDGLILGVLLFPFLRRYPQVLTAFLLGILFNTLIVQGLKSYLSYPRPAGVLDPETFRVLGPILTARAFPSGHAATGFLVAGILAYFFRGRIRVVVFLGATVIAISRIAVGAHWPQDVLAGALIGWGVGCTMAFWISARQWFPQHARGLLWLGGVYFLAGLVTIVWYPQQYPGTVVTHLLLPLIAWGWGSWQLVHIARNPHYDRGR